MNVVAVMAAVNGLLHSSMSTSSVGFPTYSFTSSLIFISSTTPAPPWPEISQPDPYLGLTQIGGNELQITNIPGQK